MSFTLEIIHTDFPRGGYRAALFDFDGTLSLIRAGWQDVMVPMMVDTLAATGTGESREQLTIVVDEFVARLTGKQTIYQMMQLAEEVSRRGGTPRAPLEYKRQYHDLLWRKIEGRVAALRSGTTPPDDLTVPGSRALLERLSARGLTLYLASGTDLQYVLDESAALKLDHFFAPRIYAALDDYKQFSKALTIERMIRETGLSGRQIVGFGDGYVEIEEVKRVGGLAVGVASNEDTRTGVNLWKRRRLIEAGADVIVADYRRLDELLDVIGVATT